MRQVNLSGRITLEDAEAVVTQLSAAPENLQPLRLDLSDAIDVEVGAGPRIGNALRRYAPHGLEIVVPPSTEEAWRGYFSKYWSLFSRSGLGLAIATHAKKIITAPTEATVAFRDYFLAEGRLASQNLIVIRNIHSIPGVDAESPNTFTSSFYGYFPKLNIPSGAFPRESLTPLIDLCREAILNVRDHAFRKPLPSGTQILTYLSLRYYREIFRFSSDAGLLRQYLRRLRERAQPNSEESLGFLEIVVSDDGVGIAARQSQNEEIYWETKDNELMALMEALRTGGSIKPIAMDAIIRGDPGYGFSIMAEGLRKLRGFASLRTGRFLATCDGTRRDPLSGAFKIDKGRSSSQLGVLPGTLIQALVPIASPQEGLELR